MIKIFCCKSGRSCRLKFLRRFTAGPVVEAGGARRRPAAASQSRGGPANANTNQSRKIFAVAKFIQENENKRQPLRC